MTSREFIEKMTMIQENISNFIECDDDIEENLHNLNLLFISQNIYENHFETKSILRLIAKISDHHHRTSTFFYKIEQLLLLFKKEIQKDFSNLSIFNIFEGNKRIILFLFKEKIITIDNHILKKLPFQTKYFSPEIKSFIEEDHQNNEYKLNKSDSTDDNWSERILNEIPENFNEKREKGENHNLICMMIQKDSVKEFITYVNKTNYDLKSEIIPSIYETNSFLIENKKTTLIEYAAFNGSIQIFQYLRINNVEMTPSLWLYAIHGQNAEIIYLIEENNFELNDETCRKYLKESIKCHHNAIAKYFLENYLQYNEDNLRFASSQGIIYHNFEFIKSNFIDKSSFYDLCKYDYCSLVDILLHDINENIDINGIRVFLLKYFNKISNKIN